MILLSISFVFIFFGYMLKGNADIFIFTGYGFLFILSVMIIPGTPGDLEYTTGTTITESDGTYTATDIKEAYSDFIIGFFLSSAAIFGFINQFVTRKSTGGFGNEQD